MNHQIITSPSGERLVVLPEAEFARLVEAAEDAADVRAYDEIRQKLATGEEELLPAEMVSRMLAGESPIRVWREHRGLTARILAEKAGLAQAYVSQVETGKRAGTVETLKKLANALGVGLDDIA